METFSKKHPKWFVVIAMIFTSILRALAMSVFYVPNKIANGGASGIASIINNLVPKISVGTVMVAINIPLIILAFIFINKSFTIKTLIGIFLTSALTDLFMFIRIPTFTDDVFVATLAGGVLWGVALGFVLKINCSTGGSDIVGLLIQNKFPNAKVVWLIFAFDCMVGIAGGIAFKSLPVVLYSCVTIYMASFLADIVGRGFVSTVEVRIISDKHQEIADFVINEFKRSITAFRCTGMYTQAEKLFLVCVVRKRQAQLLKQKIQEIDPKAFFYMGDIREVVGNGFDNTLNPSCKIK